VATDEAEEQLDLQSRKERIVQGRHQCPVCAFRFASKDRVRLHVLQTYPDADAEKLCPRSLTIRRVISCPGMIHKWIGNVFDLEAMFFCFVSHHMHCMMFLYRLVVR
jgi:hypothetical protein